MANAVCVDNKSNKIKIRSETVRFGELLCNTVKKNVSNKKKKGILKHVEFCCKKWTDRI